MANALQVVWHPDSGIIYNKMITAWIYLSIIKPIQEAITVTKKATDETETDNSAEFTDKDFAKLDKEAQAKMLDELTEQMRSAAKRLDFEQAATLRDTIMELKTKAKK